MLVRRNKLGEQVAQALLGEIQSGIYQPGSRLPSEIDLMKKFEVSRTVVREAINTLTVLGIVTVGPRKGIVVTDGYSVPMFLHRNLRSPVAAGALHLLEYRKIIEIRTSQLAAQRADSEDIEVLESKHQLMESSIRRGERGYREDVEFHLALTRCAHNPVLTEVMTNITNSLAVVRWIQSDWPRNRERAIEEHSDLVHCVKSRDEAAIAQVMSQHLTGIENDIMKYLNDSKDDGL